MIAILQYRVESAYDARKHRAQKAPRLDVDNVVEANELLELGVGDPDVVVRDLGGKIRGHLDD